MRSQTNSRHRHLAVFFLALAIAFVFFMLWTRQKGNLSPNHNQPAKPGQATRTGVLSNQTQDTITPTGMPKPAQIKAFDDSVCDDVAQEMKLKKSSTMLKNQLEELNKKADQELDKKLSLSTQNPSPQNQAPALYLQAQAQANKARTNFFRQHTDCELGNACEVQAMEVANLAKRDGINEIARLAGSSSDPQLYAMAFHACNSLLDNQYGYCQQISANQWAQRDPENATAWLHTITHIAQTSKGKPNAELDAAMFRLSQTKKFDVGLSSLSHFQTSEQMQSENAFVRQNLIRLSMEIFMGESLPAYQHILSYCTSDAMLDSNRWQICDGIANNLLGDESNLIGISIALKLAERLAWTPEKIAQRSEELDAIHELQRTVFDNLTQPSSDPGSDPISQARQSCRWMVKNANELENRLQYGEMHELRTRMAQQKIPRAELAARYRASKNSAQVKTTPPKAPAQ